MADWPADGTTNWNAAMKAFLAVSFNTDGTPKSSIFGFSAYTNLDSDGATMLVAHAYKAATDGFVTVYATTNGEGRIVLSYVGLTDDPVGAGVIVQYNQTYGNAAEISQSFPVAKDEYFEIISANATATIIRWKSIGTLSKPVDQD